MSFLITAVIYQLKSKLIIYSRIICNMKVKRSKKVKKDLNFFINNYGFRQPYQLLVDGTFCLAALNNKINIADNIPRYLQSEVKLLTTQCVILEMESLGHKVRGGLIILKNYVVHKCGHEGKPVPASKCVLSMIKQGNTSHYMVASQDRDLQQRLRAIVGVPLLYLHGATPVLEQPSQANIEATRQEAISTLERQTIDRLKVKSGLLTDQDQAPKKKKKKKGPNPLSCKKKKHIVQETGKIVKSDHPKDKRKKVRIPQHVKEILLNKNN